MENVTDALYMGFAALAFVLALSISISAFSRVTEVSQFMIDTRDRESGYTYVKYQDSSGNIETNRIVSAETIVPNLYRVFEENYIVRFFDSSNNPINILKYEINNKTTNEINQSDINGSIGNLSNANEFIENLLKGTINSNPKFNTKIQLLPNESFYDIIKGSTWVETLGIYYYDDLHENYIDDINKTAMRVITYTQSQ